MQIWTYLALLLILYFYIEVHYVQYSLDLQQS